MCRHLGYLGSPVGLGDLLLEPAHSLLRQSYAPRHQDVGRINADGWGVGWYDRTVASEPARYRTATPMWADHRFEGIARFIRADHVVAAVRNATPGLPVEDSGAAPFVADHYLFSHNGWVADWHDGVGVQLRRGVSERREAGIGGRSDSEVVFALVLDLLDKGTPPADALATVIADLREVTGGRFNFLLSDGEQVVATRDGNTLFVHEADGRERIVASEPHDDRPGWRPVPEGSVVTMTRAALRIDPL
jgi:glutamine amidotransferase